MNEDELLVSLESPLSFALPFEAHGDANAAVTKTAAYSYNYYCSISVLDN